MAFIYSVILVRFSIIFVHFQMSSEHIKNRQIWDLNAKPVRYSYPIGIEWFFRSLKRCWK